MLDRPNIDFAIPTSPVEIGDFLLGNRGVSHGADDDGRFLAAVAAFYFYRELPDADRGGHCFVGPLVHPIGPLGFAPFSDVVLRPNYVPLGEVCGAVAMAYRHKIDSLVDEGQYREIG